MAEFSTRERRGLAREGEAMQGGRFPIRNRSDLQNAIRAVGRVEPNTPAARAKVRRFIMRRARDLGLTDLIPGTWASDGSLKS